MIISGQERLSYLDLLKGFAIFLMVMGHFLAWTFPADVDRGFYPLFVKNVIYSFHMPLFFFVSGYLVDYKNREWNLKEGVTLSWRRVLTLLLPGATFCLIFYAWTDVLYYQWFLKVLFEIQVFFIMTKVFAHYAIRKKKLEMVFQFVLLGLIFWFKAKTNDLTFSKVLGIPSFCNFYPYFLLGYVFCKYRVNEYIKEKNWLYTISLLIWCGLFFMARDVSFFGKKYVIAMTAIVVCVKLAQEFNYSSGSIILNIFVRGGKMSLAIYLLSSMFVPSFPELGLYFINADAYERYGAIAKSLHVTTVFLQLVSGVAVATYVCFVCGILKKIIEKSAILNFILFGEKK